MHDIEEVERVQLYHCTKPIPDCGLGTDHQSQRQRVLIPPEGEFINPAGAHPIWIVQIEHVNINSR